ncbi:MAG: EF-hand domain-containing protein [Chromatiales bacterium]|jgi:calcium-binding protein CML|nr:EF-hand domain-containing protein [Chromatiales bacterium]
MLARPDPRPQAEASPELRIAFARYDEDGDGRITFGEFVLLLAELGDELSHPEKLLAFDATDTNGDGVIDYDEFAAWWDDA